MGGIKFPPLSASDVRSDRDGEWRPIRLFCRAGQWMDEPPCRISATRWAAHPDYPSCLIYQSGRASRIASHDPGGICRHRISCCRHPCLFFTSATGKSLSSSKLSDIALITGGVAAILQPLSGDLLARTVATYNPIKLAAVEGTFPHHVGGFILDWRHSRYLHRNDLLRH